MIYWNQFGNLGCKLKRRVTLPTSLFLPLKIGISGDKAVILLKLHTQTKKPDVSSSNWGEDAQIWKKKS